MKNRTNLDTFAWHTGRLVIGVFDDDTPDGPLEILETQGKPAVRAARLVGL
jgi:serine/threonine protein phosphatase 1